MDKILNKYLKTIIKARHYSSENNLKFYLIFLFKDIEFYNKNVLDIGGGSGIFSFYAASRGARKVICLEPIAEGSKDNMEEKFRQVRVALGLSGKVKFVKSTLQFYNAGRQKFDVIISHNSINHLDEKTCINLSRSSYARKKYQKIFLKLHSLVNDNAQLVFIANSKYNIFAFLHIKNPFVPAIEWDKHQSPYFWASLLEKVGFKMVNIRWSTFNRLYFLGRLLLGNRFASYFLSSHFCLTMKK